MPRELVHPAVQDWPLSPIFEPRDLWIGVYVGARAVYWGVPFLVFRWERRGDRPVRVTLPAREPGARRIMAGGVQVGHALVGHRKRWTAYLWNAPSDPHMGIAGEVKGADLRNLRDLLTERLASRGAWWR